MTDITVQEYFEGVEVDLTFIGKGPSFGDLFTICGYENPHFPPAKEFNFGDLANLQFSQIDDYFGIQTTSDGGEEVAVWLFPLKHGEIVHHHPGPFDGLRVSYNVLKNPIRRSEHFFLVLDSLNNNFSVKLSTPIENVQEKASKIFQYWIKQKITPGSDEALVIDY